MKAHSTELGKLASAHAVTQKALIAAQEDLAVSQQTAAEVGALKAKVVSLETTVQGMKAKEKELKEELDGWLRQEGTVSRLSIAANMLTVQDGRHKERTA